MLLSTTTPSRMKRMLTYLTDEYEFLGPYGIRSLSRYHHRHPFEINHNGESFKVTYMQRESTDESVGKNNNWRGPMWMPCKLVIGNISIYLRQCSTIKIMLYGVPYIRPMPCGVSKGSILSPLLFSDTSMISKIF